MLFENKSAYLSPNRDASNTGNNKFTPNYKYHWFYSLMHKEYPVSGTMKGSQKPDHRSNFADAPKST